MTRDYGPHWVYMDNHWDGYLWTIKGRVEKVGHYVGSI